MFNKEKNKSFKKSDEDIGITSKEFLETARHYITHQKMREFEDYIFTYKVLIDIADDKRGLIQWAIEKRSAPALAILKKIGADFTLGKEKTCAELVWLTDSIQFYNECYQENLINDEDIKKWLRDFAIQYQNKVREPSLEEVKLALEKKFGKLISDGKILFVLTDFENLLTETTHNGSRSINGVFSNEDYMERFCKKILRDREDKIREEAEQALKEEKFDVIQFLLKDNPFLQKQCPDLLKFYINEALNSEIRNIEKEFNDNIENDVRFIELLFNYTPKNIKAEDMLGLSFSRPDARVKIILINLANKNPLLCQEVIKNKLNDCYTSRGDFKSLRANFIFFQDLVNNYQGNFEKELKDITEKLRKLQGTLNHKDVYRQKLNEKIESFASICVDALKEYSKKREIISFDETENSEDVKILKELDEMKIIEDYEGSYAEALSSDTKEIHTFIEYTPSGNVKPNSTPVSKKKLLLSRVF